MAIPGKTTGLTYRDLEAMFPEDDKVIRELIDGELFVTPPPTYRHQRVVLRLAAALYSYEKEHGGSAVTAPAGVYLDDSNFVEPDVLFLRRDHLDRVQGAYVRAAPDLVVEVSSPSTRARDVTKKRELYGRFGVPEYWFVDLDTDRVEVYRLVQERFEKPEILGRKAVLEPRELAGFAISVDELLGPHED
jgi:Uma2 family endonuclease